MACLQLAFSNTVAGNVGKSLRQTTGILSPCTQQAVFPVSRVAKRFGTCRTSSRKLTCTRRARPFRIQAAAAGTGAVRGAAVRAAQQQVSDQAGEHFLDGISEWLVAKVEKSCNCTIDGIEQFGFLPDGVHKMIHQHEKLIVVVVRELLVLWLVYAFVANCGTFCRKLNEVWGKVVRRDAEITEDEFQASGFRALQHPLSASIILLNVTHWCKLLAPYFKVKLSQQWVGDVRQVGLIMCFSFFLLEWMKRLFKSLRATSREDLQRLVFAERVSTAVVLLGTLMAVAEATGFAFRSIITIGGIPGIALGLAAKEMAANFIGGIILFLVRPFKIGDSIKTDKFAGTVQDITFSSTRLMGSDRVPITVPNQAFISSVVTNYSQAEHKVLEGSFALRLQDILLVDKITAEITALLEKHEALDPTQAKPFAFLKSCGPNNLEIGIYAVARNMSGFKFNSARQQIFLQAADIIVKNGGCIGQTAPFGPPASA